MRLIPNLHSEGRSPTGVVPMKCAVTNRGDDPEGFIATDNNLMGFDPKVFISVAAVKEMAHMLGMVSPEDIEPLVKRAQELEKEFAEAQKAIDAMAQIKELEQSLPTEARKAVGVDG